MINPPLAEPADPRIAELERLFEGQGWVFGKSWLTANSGPDWRNLTAMKGVVVLVAPDVASLAEKIRRAEAGG